MLKFVQRLAVALDVHQHIMGLVHLLDRIGHLAPTPVLEAMNGLPVVIRLLDAAKAIGILEEVKDEGHFWDNRDVKALVETVGQWNTGLAGLTGLIKDQFPGQIVAAPIGVPRSMTPRLTIVKYDSGRPVKPSREAVSR